MLEQNGRLFGDKIVKWIFLQIKCGILIQSSLEFNLQMVQLTKVCICAKPFPELMMFRCTHLCKSIFPAHWIHLQKYCTHWIVGIHDDVIKWKHFPRNWPFVWGIHRSPVNSPHKGQWRAALMFTLICVWINGCVNNREAGNVRRYYAHYGVTVMKAVDFVTLWGLVTPYIGHVMSSAAYFTNRD